VALAYVLNQQSPTFPLMGPVSVEEARSSLAALDVELSSDDVQWLNLEV
jgi:aryl-alcohol dehydrogenase-like predicted oxidoreductase